MVWAQWISTSTQGPAWLGRGCVGGEWLFWACVTSAVLPPQLSPRHGPATHLPAQLSPCSPCNPCQEKRGNMSRASPTASCPPVLPPTRRDAGRGLGTGKDRAQAQGASWMHHKRKAFPLEPMCPCACRDCPGLPGDRAPARPLQTSRPLLPPMGYAWAFVSLGLAWTLEWGVFIFILKRSPGNE